MAKLLNKVLKKHRKKIFIVIAVIFIILIIYGLTMSPDKTWHNPKVEKSKQIP